MCLICECLNMKRWDVDLMSEHRRVPETWGYNVNREGKSQAWHCIDRRLLHSGSVSSPLRPAYCMDPRRSLSACVSQKTGFPGSVPAKRVLVRSVTTWHRSRAMRELRRASTPRDAARTHRALPLPNIPCVCTRAACFSHAPFVCPY